MKSNLDFLFLLEHEDREGASIRKIMNILKSHGYSSKAQSITFHAHNFRKISPKCIVFPYAISGDMWPLNYFNSKNYNGVKMISLSWEQYLSQANLEFKRPRGNLVCNDFYHLAWFDDYRNYLVKNGVKKSKIKVIGNLTSSLLMESIKKVDKKLDITKEFGITNKEILFFPMNYGWAFFDKKKLKAKIKLGYDSKIAFQYHEYSKKCLHKFISFIDDVAKQNPMKSIVIRPHPSVSEEDYKNTFQKLNIEIPENVLITKKYTVIDWVAYANIVGSSWSTVVWDSICLGKKSFLFTPFQRPSWLNTFWNDLVPNISNANEIELLKEDRGLLVHDKDSIKLTAEWLIDICNNGMGVSSINTNLKSFLKLVYCLRSYGYYISMKHLNGLFVPKGLRRDFFK